MLRMLNLKKTPEKASDWHFGKVVQASTILPKKVDLEPFCGPIRDQGITGFCHSFAGAALKNIQERLEMGSQCNFSPLDLAKHVKAIDSYRDTEGSDIGSVVKALYDYGTIYESVYSFDAYKPGSLVFPALTEEKRSTYDSFKVKNYARCNGLLEIKQALALNKPVILGMFVGNNFYDLDNNKSKFLELPFNTALSGHAILAVGYDDTLSNGKYTGFVRIQNSWGTNWGDNGFAWMPYAYFTFKSDMGVTFNLDAFTTIDLDNDPLKADVIELWVNSSRAVINGVDFYLDQPPLIDPQSSRTLVPVRFIAEKLGCEVGWDNDERKITIIKHK